MPRTFIFLSQCHVVSVATKIFVGRKCVCYSFIHGWDVLLIVYIVAVADLCVLSLSDEKIFLRV